jgi:hypothetical protein
MTWQRTAAALAGACLLAMCTPVRQPMHCAQDTDCEAGLRCNNGERRCMRADAVRGEDAATAQQSGCVRDADCETSGPCETVVCEGGRCLFTPVPSGMLLAASDQRVGDCRMLECDGKGETQARSDDADQPVPDGNPCHALSCDNGKVVTSNVPDGSECNEDGVCQAGECSVCFEGADCTGVEDCTIMRVRCSGATSMCEPTDEGISGKTCGAGKVCSDGVCEDCRVGDSCGDVDPCLVSRITSCNPKVCDRSALTGTSCGSDASGQAKICNAGQCVYACKAGACGQNTGNPCELSLAVCDSPDAEPTCTVTAVEDGTPCESNGTCYQRTCVRPVLVNGDFSRGLEGWTLYGDATKFPVTQDPANDMRWTVSTRVADSPTAVGSVSQDFVVPDDALVLRFNVWGGTGTVQLRDANGGRLESVTGTESEDRRVPVSWDLSGRRGQTLTLIIADELATDARWSYVNATGFDVIREVPSPIVNWDFSSQLTGWETSGDGPNFNVYNDWNYGSPDLWQEAAYGRRVSVSSYVYRVGSQRLGNSAVGTISQTFTVPADASALRFNLCGGMSGRAVLYDGAMQLYEKTGNDTDLYKVPVSWDLVPYRGKVVRLVLVDESTSGSFPYIGLSSVDVITSFNGP